MDDQQKCYFVEANLTPGITMKSSYFPYAFEIGSKLNYDQVLNLIVEAAQARKWGKIKSPGGANEL